MLMRFYQKMLKNEKIYSPPLTFGCFHLRRNSWMFSSWEIKPKNCKTHKRKKWLRISKSHWVNMKKIGLLLWNNIVRQEAEVNTVNIQYFWIYVNIQIKQDPVCTAVLTNMFFLWLLLPEIWFIFQFCCQLNMLI